MPSLFCISRHFLEKIQVFSSHISAKAASNNDTKHHHNLLSPCLGLVLQSFLGVVGSPSRVFYGTLHMIVYSIHHFALKDNNLSLGQNFILFISYLKLNKTYLINIKKQISC